MRTLLTMRTTTVKVITTSKDGVVSERSNAHSEVLVKVKTNDIIQKELEKV